MIKQPPHVDRIDLASWWNSSTRRAAGAAQPRPWLRQTKFMLPAIGLLLLLLAFIWPAFLPAMPDIKVALEKLRPGVTEELAMFDLHYRGTDKTGAPFAVEASKAVRSGAVNEVPLVTLTMPQADLKTRAGNAVTITSDTGQYDEKTQALTLEGDVALQHDKGAVFRAPVLDVDFAKNTAQTDQPVNVQGDFGTISAPAGMMLEEGGDRVIFKAAPDSRAHATIKAAPQNGLANTAPAAPAPVK